MTEPVISPVQIICILADFHMYMDRNVYNLNLFVKCDCLYLIQLYMLRLLKIVATV